MDLLMGVTFLSFFHMAKSLFKNADVYHSFLMILGSSWRKSHPDWLANLIAVTFLTCVFAMSQSGVLPRKTKVVDIVKTPSGKRYSNKVFEQLFGHFDPKVVHLPRNSKGF